MNKQILKFYLNTCDFLINLLDVREIQFRKSAHVMARYAELLATELELSENTTSEVILSAYFCNIGNLLTHIHEKFEDGASSDSYDLIETFIKKINPPFDIMNILDHKNEHYDGGGPLGLRGNAIPLASRILLLIKYFDDHLQGEEELDVIKKERALRKIASKSGSVFDPKIVEAFVTILKKDHTDTKDRISFIRQKALIIIAGPECYTASLLKLRFIKEGFNVRSVQEVKALEELIDSREGNMLIIDQDFEDSLSQSFSPEIPFVIFSTHDKQKINSNLLGKALHLYSHPLSIDEIVRNTHEYLRIHSKKSDSYKETAGFFEEAGNFYKAAEVYRALGDFGHAASMYEKAEDFNLAAEMYLALDDGGSAAKAYERAKKFDLAAKYYGNIGNLLKQNEMFEKVGKFYSLGKNYFRNNKLDEAIVVLQKVDIASSDFKKACHLLGKIFMGQRRFSMAITSFLKAISGEAINKRNCKSYYLLGRSYEAQNLLEETVSMYEKILGEQFDYLDVMSRLDIIKKKIEEQKEAEEKAKEAARFIIPSKIEEAKKPRYTKIKEVGRGGMGSVYQATDTVLDRTVALKVLSANLQKDTKVVETFIREAKSAARLNHINIVTVYDAGIQEGSYYIAMEFIDGSTIREILKNRRLSIGSVIGLLKQITRGLDYAHRNSIIHRDLTTNNIMLTKNKIVKIMDFGLARVILHLMSEQSIIGGTPSFMSPEQVEGDPIDHRSDIYTLGVSLFEMSTGEVPFKKGDLGYHHLHTKPPEPKSINPKIPDFLNSLILRCLEKDPNNRFQSVGEIIELLAREAK